MLGESRRRGRGGCLRRWCSRQAKRRRSDLSPSVGFLVALVFGTILWAALWLTWRLARLVFA